MPAYRAVSYETPGQSIYIATPCYESVKAGYALSLAKVVQELTRRHIPHAINILFGNCHVDDGRNECVRDFLENTQCTDLVFWDADVMAEPSEFLKLIRHKTSDIVAGAYPFKSNSGKFPVGKILGGTEGKAGAATLLSVSYAPTGFMRIPRGVFETLSPAGHGKLNPSRRFFQRRYTDNTYDGGDVTFCRKWIAAGGSVYVDPNLTLRHIGEQVWTGNFQSYLANPENAELHTTKSTDPVPSYKRDAEEFAALFRDFAQIAAPTLEDFQRLADAYGNKPWAATAEFLQAIHAAAHALPDDARILECGTGLTTLVLASSKRAMVCVEEHREWAEKLDELLQMCGLNADIVVAAVQDGWHDKAKAMLAGMRADLVVIDGPRRRAGVDRMWPISAEAQLAGVAAANAVVLADDVAQNAEVARRGRRQFSQSRLGDQRKAAS